MTSHRAIACLALLLFSSAPASASAQASPYVYEASSDSAYVQQGGGVLPEGEEGALVQDGLTYVYSGAPDGAFQLVTFEPEGPLSLYVAGARRRDPIALCVGACTIALEAGDHRLAIGRGDGDPQRAAATLTVSPTGAAALLHGSYEDREVLRAVGWATLVTGVLGGIALSVTGSMMGNSFDASSFELAPVLLGTGMVVMVAGLVAGSYLVGLRDLGHVEF